MYITGRGSQQSGVPHHNLNLERLEKHHLTAPQLQCTHHPQSTEDFTSFNLEFLDSVALGASSWYFPQRSPSTQPPTTPLIPVERPSDLPPVTNPPTPPQPTIQFNPLSEPTIWPGSPKLPALADAARHQQSLSNSERNWFGKLPLWVHISIRRSLLSSPSYVCLILIPSSGHGAGSPKHESIKSKSREHHHRTSPPILLQRDTGLNG